MVQQTIDSKISEHGAGHPETDLLSGDEEVTVVDRKQTALKDLQNNKNVSVPDSIGKSCVLKDIGPVTNPTKLSGAKRASPECPESPSQLRSPSNNSTNGQLVYVRRKSEADLGKTITRDSTNINSNSLNSKTFNQQPATTQPVSPVKESKVTCFPAFAPIPSTSSAIPSGKPSVPPILGKPGMKLPSAEPNHRPHASATTSAGNLETLRNLHWEARYSRLQSLLRKLDQREQENYIRCKFLNPENVPLDASCDSCFWTPIKIN